MQELVTETVPSGLSIRKTRGESRFVLRVGVEELVLGKEISIEASDIEVGILDALVEDIWLGKESVPVGFVGASCKVAEFGAVKEDGVPDAVDDWTC